MKKFIKIILIFCLLTTSFVLKKSNEQLPNIEIKDIDGNSVNIKDYGYNGKITIISFWATFCGPCIKELDNMSLLYDDWVDEYNLEMVAITIDDARNIPKVKPMVNGRGWPYEVLLDQNRDVARALNVTNPPMTFLIDKEGNIVYKHTGYTEGAEYKLESEIKKLIR